MPKTTKAKPKRKPFMRETFKKYPDEAAAALEERKRLNARIRVEKEIVRLSGALERAIRKADHRLIELGGALMARGARVNQLEAQRDMAREQAIHERMPAPVE